MENGKIIYDVCLGAMLFNAIKDAIQISKATNRNVHFKFNGTDLVATPTSSIEDIRENFNAQRNNQIH